jgi:hypothetical protein
MNGHEHVHVDGHGACSLPRQSAEEILFFQVQNVLRTVRTVHTVHSIHSGFNEDMDHLETRQYDGLTAGSKGSSDDFHFSPFERLLSPI